MPRQEIAVIGAGPKAVALAAKAWCLQKTRLADVHITIFEQHEVGAHWTGTHGYTDGKQALCTPAERDLGFPYDEENFGAPVAAQMQAHFSWMAHGLRNQTFADWVNRGREPPTHGEFASYLQEAVRLSGATFVQGEVASLKFAPNGWSIGYRSAPQGSVRWAGSFDGVVVTGPGPQSSKFPVSHAHAFNGVSFWQSLPTVKSLASELAGEVVILGGGGTAAAAAAWLIRNGFADHDIRILANQAALYLRAPCFFEDRVFDDDAFWESLGSEHRQEFTQRLTRSIVWQTVAQELGRARKLHLTPAKVDGVSVSAATEGEEAALVVKATLSNGADAEYPAALLVDATGFDGWWFSRLNTGLDAEVAARRDHLSGGINYDLSLPIDSLPRLHAPFVAGVEGPGLTSLMALGRMSDRILLPYVERARP